MQSFLMLLYNSRGQSDSGFLPSSVKKIATNNKKHSLLCKLPTCLIHLNNLHEEKAIKKDFHSNSMETHSSAS